MAAASHIATAARRLVVETLLNRSDPEAVANWVNGVLLSEERPDPRLIDLGFIPSHKRADILANLEAIGGPLQRSDIASVLDTIDLAAVRDEDLEELSKAVESMLRKVAGGPCAEAYQLEELHELLWLVKLKEISGDIAKYRLDLRSVLSGLRHG